MDTSVLKYDPESKTYNWTNEDCGDKSCSICLEDFGTYMQMYIVMNQSFPVPCTHELFSSTYAEPRDVIVSSICSHANHRDCIMAWLKVKDECPYCRHLMWDAETFNLMEADILRTNSRGAEEPETTQLSEEPTHQPGVVVPGDESDRNDEAV
jgi:hypothetical protein